MRDYATWMSEGLAVTETSRSRKRVLVDMPAGHDDATTLHAHHKRMRQMFALANKVQIEHCTNRKTAS